MRILNVIKGIGYGGASRSLCAISKALQAAGDCRITVASLTPADGARAMFDEAGIRILETPSPTRLRKAVGEADIVQVEWWNSPQIDAFLRSRLPASRLAAWVHVAGDRWPHAMPRQLPEFADFTILGCPYAAKCVPEECRERTEVIYSTADFERLESLEPRSHEGFNVGYVGTASFKKMHPRFVAMSAAVRVPGSRFVVCGEGDLDLLKRQAADLGARSRFDFRGYVHDIGPVLGSLDVYGYPLCDPPGAELNVQEAMFAGIPPVVFGIGGLGDIVRDGETGMVVESEAEYTGVIEYLFHNRDERLRLGRNAREFAMASFGGARSAAKLSAVYDRMMEKPKRAREWRVSDASSMVAGEGARRFIESVHPQAPFFVEAARGSASAEAEIAGISPRELTVLRAYHKYYPDDSLLRRWDGMAVRKDDVPRCAGAREEREMAAV